MNLFTNQKGISIKFLSASNIEYKNSSKIKIPMKPNLTFILLISASLFLINVKSVAQKYKRGSVYELNVDKLNNSNNVTWYGWDFSTVKITDFIPKSEVADIKERYIPAMIKLLNKEFSVDWVDRKLNKDTFSSNLSEIQMLHNKIDETTLITYDDYELTIDSIKAIVSSYKLSKKDGIGFVVIMENLNKPNRMVSSYPTFFDISSREILLTARMTGKPGSKYGFVKWWEEGILETLFYFIRKYY
ncbi:MAG: hypothetical protein IPI46_07960 [Bacteroidetes bacterium]|nr:hypothetical protein [Bacteroidota bacterium]